MAYNVSVLFIKKSSNRKVGQIPVVTSESKTCPSACPLKNNGCYADYGPMKLKWMSLEGKGRKDIKPKKWGEMCQLINELPDNQLWRCNDAGDLPGNNNTINLKLLNKLVEANKGKAGFSYTHKPVGIPGQKIFEKTIKKHRVSYKTARTNARAILAANKNGFRINLSADSLEEADELYDLGIGPVVLTCPSDAPQNHKTPKGRHVVICPAQYAEVTCEQCRLCAKERKAIVGFWVHGTGAKKVNNRLKVVQ